MTTIRLQNAYIVCHDSEQLRSFYDDVLQLPLKFADGSRWVQYAAGGTNVALASRDEAPSGVNGTVLVFEVESFESFRERAVTAGGKLLGERDMGSHGRTLTIEDPEGNVLQLFCRAR